MKITEHNLLTGEIVEREQTAAELAQVAADKVSYQAEADAQIAKVAARQAVLDKLGLTEQEAQLLLGS